MYGLKVKVESISAKHKMRTTIRSGMVAQELSICMLKYANDSLSEVCQICLLISYLAKIAKITKLLPKLRQHKQTRQ